jgi:hypothetical protein
MLIKAGMVAEIEDISNSSKVLRLDSQTKVDVIWKPIINSEALSFAQYAIQAEQNIVVFATKSLSHQVFLKCVESATFVLDTFGNGVVRLPRYYYERFVEPKKTRRPPVSGTPFTAKASRIVRAFLSDPDMDWSQSDLVELTKVTQSYASKCLKMLAEHTYIVAKGNRWQVQSPSVLLEDWSAHYRFDRHKMSRFAFSSPSYDDGLQRLRSKFREIGIEHAFTGWSGAHLRAPYAIPPKAMLFVKSLPENPQKIGLYPVVEKENVLLILPHDEGVFQFTRLVNGLVVASDAQIYIDLKRLPGRAGEQAEILRKRHMKWDGLNNE